MAIEALIARYGLFAVLAGAGLEGDAAVLAGGLLAHQGLLPLPGVMAAAAVGSFLADQAYFQIGRRFRTSKWVSRLAARRAFAHAMGQLQRRPVGFILFNALAALVWGTLIASIGYAFGHGVETAFGRMQRIEHVAIAAGALLTAAVFIAWIVRQRQKRKAGAPAR